MPQTVGPFCPTPSFITVVEPSATKEIPEPGFPFHCTSDQTLTGVAKGEYEIDRRSHLQSYGIVHGMSQRLLRPQVPLRGLDRGMAEEQLDLL